MHNLVCGKILAHLLIYQAIKRQNRKKKILFKATGRNEWIQFAHSICFSSFSERLPNTVTFLIFRGRTPCPCHFASLSLSFFLCFHDYFYVSSPRKSLWTSASAKSSASWEKREQTMETIPKKDTERERELHGKKENDDDMVGALSRFKRDRYYCYE